MYVRNIVFDICHRTVNYPNTPLSKYSVVGSAMRDIKNVKKQ